MEFEKNHRGEKDVALFDFTSLFASENAARIIERKGKRILLCVAGDSLLEVRQELNLAVGFKITMIHKNFNIGRFKFGGSVRDHHSYIII